MIDRGSVPRPASATPPCPSDRRSWQSAERFYRSARRGPSASTSAAEQLPSGAQAGDGRVHSLARRGPHAQLQRLRTKVFALMSALSRMSSAARAVWPSSAAHMSAVQPSCDAPFKQKRSHFSNNAREHTATSVRTRDAGNKPLHAHSSQRMRTAFFALTSAPSRMSSIAVAVWPQRAAQMRAVSPCWFPDAARRIATLSLAHGNAALARATVPWNARWDPHRDARARRPWPCGPRAQPCGAHRRRAAGARVAAAGGHHQHQQRTRQ
jgi:hypothetical protein